MALHRSAGPTRVAARRTTLLVVAVFSVLIAWATPAAAHSELISTSPSSGALVATSPDVVELRFNQPVEASLGAVRVFDRDAGRIDVGAVTKQGPDVVRATLPRLADGGYVVTWRVTSADSHPIQGAFTFRVGTALVDADDAALAQRLLAESGGSRLTGLALAGSRWLALAGLLVIVGGGVFVTAIDRDARSDVVVRRTVWLGWASAVAGTVGGILAQAPYAAGLPLSSAFDADLLAAVVDTRFGQVWSARLALLVLAGLLLVAVFRRAGSDHPRSLTVPAALLGVALLATPALSGHAAAGPWPAGAIVLDVVHLAAVSTWIGGLVVLLVARLRSGRDDPRAAVTRFSRIALISVVVVLVTGVAQGWREVSPIASLWSTTYGALLLGKLALFGAIVAVAAVSRRWVQRRVKDAADVRLLRRAVGAEVGVASVALIVTSLLVAAPPARVSFARPFQETLRTDDLWIDVSIEPAKAGSTDMHVYTYLPGGSLTPVEEVSLALRLPGQDIGPLEVPIQRAGPAHFAVYGFDLPLAGRWTVDVTARLNAFDQVQASTEVDVR